MLKLVNIIKEYNVAGTKVAALKGIDLEFRQNEFVSILGQSGCGKTTMLNLIGGLDRYTSGDLIINGKSTKEFADGEWDSYRNNSIGFVFQSYNLIPHLTVLGNVELALTLSGVSKHERVKRATEVLSKVGLADQLNKKPNQMSGGQMQRVAIARALINNPDIILADEPTGALDSETSVQIMELLKEVAKEKLVIMVTHNPELAEKYSSRIVKLLDGKLIGDSNPYKDEQSNSDFNPRKTSMSFLMALSLSLKNLITKKARTFLTAFAGSIGIIGIAMVLALSNGFQNYIDKMQADLMSTYPLELTAVTYDIDSMMSLDIQSYDKYPDSDELVVNDLSDLMSTLFHYNDLEDFQSYMDENPIDESWVNGIQVSTSMQMNIYKETNFNDVTEYKEIVTSESSTYGDTYYWSEILENEEFVNSQYDVIYGSYPTNANEIVIVVDSYNRISNTTLEVLGLLDATSEVPETISFSDIVGQQYSIFTNQDIYVQDSTTTLFNKTTMTEELFDNAALEVEIVGVLRVNEDTTAASISSTIGYTTALTDIVMGFESDSETQSDVVKYVLDENNYTDHLGNYYYEASEYTYYTSYTRENALQSLGASTVATSIKFYPVTFEAKDSIKDYIETYNDTNENGNEILYIDEVELMVSSLSTVIDSISYVLIAFTSISLVVSSIMIGIITYVSVIERTKEIGVLRSIGARKKDISRVFNAETIIIGSTAGAIAIGFTYLISIPVNFIITSLVPDMKNICSLDPIAAVVLILISITLTLVAGLIPSSIAAKKDPVTALRTE